MGKYSSPKPPLPEPLSGEKEGSFAHFTVTTRLPKIIRETLADNDFPENIRKNLVDLISEIPDTPLKPLQDTSAIDVQDWRVYLRPYRDSNWLQVPWFLVEMYLYRRILDEIEYYQPGEFEGYDPFIKQKQRVLHSASSSIINLGQLLRSSLGRRVTSEEELRADFHQLLVLNVWANQADLSMWSTSEKRPDHQRTADQRAHLLVDDADLLYDNITAPVQTINRVDFILDNFGPELVHDIGLADFLLSHELSSKVRFHAKPRPHFVSDAMIKDIHVTIDYLAEFPDKSAQDLAKRIRNHIYEGRLEIKDDYFWTSPLPFWKMPDYIREEVSESSLVISKGDANYRRLTGDLDWPFATPFDQVVSYFPVPLLAQRVLKAELALGLNPQQVQKLDYEDPDWLINGNWAVIQFFPSRL
jgi:uncharacterized protein with ATP-grasp and redox domains